MSGNNLEDYEASMNSLRLDRRRTCLSISLVIAGIMTMTTGCSKTKSENVKTSGFYATMRVGGNNANSVDCSVSFQVGGVTGTYLDLNDGDSVTCNGNSMSRSEFAGIITYSATVAYSVGSVYSLTLNRTGESPYVSTVVLPEAITGSSPSVGSSVTKGTALTASWTPSASALDSMDIRLSYSAGGKSYSYTKSDSYPEQGSLGWSSSETQVSPVAVGTWSGTLSFSRYREGTMATGLSGTITGKQALSFSINLVD